MSQKEKAKFEEMAKNDKTRYDQEMKSYVPPKGAKKGKKKKDPLAPKRPPYVLNPHHTAPLKCLCMISVVLSNIYYPPFLF